MCGQVDPITDFHETDLPEQVPGQRSDAQDVFLPYDLREPVNFEGFNWLPEEPWTDPGFVPDSAEEAELDRLFGPLRG